MFLIMEVIKSSQKHLYFNNLLHHVSFVIASVF